jgi:pimeloyl-ACP methyl ester carboxylesterase
MADTMVNGVRIHVQRLVPPQGVMPSGKTIVLLHGLIIDDLSSYYFTVANPLSLAGHDVVMYDLRGHGRSDRPATGYSIADGAAELNHLLDSLEISQPVHLIGNSYGGALAVEMALKYPERVAHVTLIEGLYADSDFGKEMAETLGVLTRCAYEEKWRKWIEDRGPKTVKMAARGVSLIESTTIQADLLETRPYSDEMLAKLRIPILAIYGGVSELLGRARKLRDLVPQMELIELAGLDHRVLLNAAPHLCKVLLWSLGGRDGELPEWITPEVPFEAMPLSRALLPELL